MVEPLDLTSGDFQALADRVVDLLVGEDDIATLAKGRNDTGDGREGLGVDDTALSAQVGGNISFRLHVDILGTIELWRAARSDAVRAQGLDSLVLDLLIGIEIVEVVSGEVGNGFAVGQF